MYEVAGRDGIAGDRVAFLVENSYDYVGKEMIVPILTVAGRLIDCEAS